MDKIQHKIKNRILQYIEIENIKKEYFFKKTGISASNFKGIGLKSDIGGDKIVKILTEFPDINPEWILTGQGTMLRSNKACIAESPNERISFYKELLDVKENKIIELSEKIGALKAKIRDLQNTSNLQSVSTADSGKLDTSDAGIQYPIVKPTTDKAIESHTHHTTRSATKK